MPFYERLVTAPFKGNGCDEFRSRHMLVYDFFMFFDFSEYAFVFVIDALRSVHNKIPFSPGLAVQFTPRSPALKFHR